MTIEAVVRAYVDAVRGGDAGAITAMFAPDGVLLLPDGRRLAGVAEIRAFYIALFAAGGPRPAIVTLTADDRRCAVELCVRFPDGRESTACDIFELGADGRLAAVRIYARN